MKFEKPAILLPYPYYFFPMILIALIGLFDSIYLAISHYRNYTDIGYQSFCAISRSLNCDTVSQSPYSIFLDVPVPVWGILGYCFFLFLMAFAWNDRAEKKRMWILLMLISMGFSIYGIALAFISSYYIHSYCVMCILSYAVNLLLLFYVWFIRSRFAGESFFPALKADVLYFLRFYRISIPVSMAFVCIAVGMIFVFPPYWHMNPPEFSKNTPTGITEDGHPWIGAETPELEIVEFSDYLCFQCKKMHYFLRRLIETHPDKIRLIHRHFPMDHLINPLVTEPFHNGAAKLALLAISAGEQEIFWKMNDYLFNISHNIKELSFQKIAEDTGLKYGAGYSLNNNQFMTILWEDIKEGIKVHGLNGTPGFIINGKVYLGHIPADVLHPYL